MNNTPIQARILYVFDTHCGWCYGFSNVINEFHHKFKARYPFTVLNGGLITGNRVGAIGPMASYILSAIPRLEQTTGVQVGKPYIRVLEEGTRVMDSVPPAMAFTILREHLPEEQITIAARMQNMQFKEGYDMSSAKDLTTLAESFGLSEEMFLTEIAKESTKEKAIAEFHHVKQLGIQGFPAVILDRGDALIALSRGYINFNQLEINLQKALSQEI